MKAIDLRSACILASCFAGCLIGVFFMSEPRAIDGALVLAGIVTYPATSAQGIYFQNMWTAIHQILGLLLWIGISQSWVTVGFCGVLGATFVSGLMLVSLALTERPALSLMIAMSIVLCAFVVQGPDYPINFMSSHSFGQIASSLTILCFGLFGNRRYLSAGLLAGLLPAFHPVSGSWAVLIISLAGLFLLRDDPRSLTRLLKGLAIGISCTILSFGYYWVNRIPLQSPVDTGVLSDFVQFWDYHRQVPYTYETSVISGLSLILLWVIFDHARQSEKPAPLNMSFLLFTSALGSWILYEGAHRLHALLPSAINGAILGRLVNNHYEVALAIIFAAILARRSAALLILALPFVLEFHVTRSVRNSLFLGMVVAAVYLLWPARKIGVQGNPERRTLSCLTKVTPDRLVIGAFAGFIAISLHYLSVRTIPECSNISIDDCRSPPVYRKFQETKWQGLTVAPAGLAMMIHRHAHKPVLLGASGFDFVPYLPQTGTQVRDIIELVYGQDFRNPSPQFRNQGNLMQEMGKAHWAKLTNAEWNELARKFCIGAIIAPSDWTIQLTPNTDENNVRLYVLPDQDLDKCRIS